MTDTLQLLLMFAGLITMLITGTIAAGGPSEVYKANKISGRLDVLEYAALNTIDCNLVWFTQGVLKLLGLPVPYVTYTLEEESISRM